MSDDGTRQALEVFVRGFSMQRSLVRPYLPHKVNPTMWLLADGEIKGPARGSELIVYGAGPDEVIDVRDRLKIGRHTLCVLVRDAADTASTAAAYKSAGYRMRRREPLFVLDLNQRARFNAVPVQRITDEAAAEKLAKAARHRQVLPQHLTTGDSDCRVYAAFEGETPVGWVRSIRTHPDCAWVAGLYVAAAHRRKGIGRTLMSAMLDDDARYGVRRSVLLASLTGAMLYPHLGYRQQGLLLIFSPRKS